MAQRSNEEILKLARERAHKFGKPMPATKADVERLTGLFYTGPDPRAIGVKRDVVVQTWNSDHLM